MLKKNFGRRRFLRGAGGVAVGLPALDIFQPRLARGQEPVRKIYSALMLEQNGSIQGNGSDPDMFWPRALGPITEANMAGIDADRTTSELKGYANKLMFVRGLNFKNSRNHDGGPIAAGTGAPVQGSGTRQLPIAESFDFFIARNLTPGKEPLTLYAGRKGTYRDDALSFSTGGTLRVGDNNPWNVFQRLSGLQAGMAADPAAIQKMAARRLSVNDLVRNDLRDLLGRTDLSKLDRERLDTHMSSVRDMEMNMGGVLGPMPVAALVDQAELQAINGQHTADPNMEKVVRMQLDLIAFAFASDRARAATLQVGGCNDHSRYVVNGVTLPPFHFISHRVLSDGGNGTSIPNAVELHHQVDRIHARYFKHFLDRLSAYSMPQGGTLLDSSINLFTNSVADGPPHSGNNIPHVLAGGAGGFLRTGIHLRTTGFTNKVLNTMITATGVRKPDGSPIDNFGDPSAAGLVNELIA